MKETTKLILSMPESMTCQQVANKLGVTYNSVISVRRRYGAEYKKQNRAARKHLPELYAMLDANKSYAEIARAVGLTAQGVHYHANKIGLSRVKEFSKTEVRKQIAEDYAKGYPLKFIANKYGCDASLPCVIAKSLGVKLRTRGGSPRHARIMQMVSAGVAATEISRQLNCALQTVYNAKRKALSENL